MNAYGSLGQWYSDGWNIGQYKWDNIRIKKNINILEEPKIGRSACFDPLPNSSGEKDYNIEAVEIIISEVPKILLYNEATSIRQILLYVVCKYYSSWPLSTVLASRSKVRWFKSSWGRWIFSGLKNPERKSSARDLKVEVPSLRFQTR